jgi:deazaflavin-dependent oxidoreductase (nitroreductase family)
MTNPDRVRAPWWLKPANRFYKLFLRRGIRFGQEPSVVLTAPGRKSGKPRSTPVTPLQMGGRRYIVGTFPGADWVANVRAADTVTLTDGGQDQQVRMVEVEPDQAAPVLRSFAEQFPSSVGFLKRSGQISTASADATAALAGRLPVFRIDPVT